MQGLDPDPISFDIFMCCYKNNGEGKRSKRILIPMSMEIQIFTTSLLL